ncbi:TRAP transporter substrate-binding protein [Acuticoccus sediminis]|uniref:TRAP transporter substrate-binding protein n=1 Tax=Acuticoccus sediminis TaxID=2184697 RepID=UPI001CFC5E78|nr:TRAP transporter substrate-binding protein [Acuticoccus sediminis]
MRPIARGFAFGIAAALSVLSALAPASAQEVTLRMATQMPSDSVEGRVHERFAELVKEYSNGEVEIALYPNDQLGKLDSVLEQLQMGTVHIFAEGAGFMKKWSPDMNWLAAPFLFKSREDWVAFMKSDTVRGWFAEAEKAAGVITLGTSTEILRGPYRVLVTTRPVDTLDDLSGLRLRLFSNKTQVDAWTYLGASVKVIPWTEVYSSMQSGLVEGTTSPISLVRSMRFNEVAPYVRRTDEYFQSVAYMVNARAWNRMTEAQQQAVTKAYMDVASYADELINTEGDEMVAALEAEGAHFAVLDTAPFVERMASFYENLQDSGELPEGFLAAVNASRTN